MTTTTYAPGRYQAEVLDQGFEEAGTGTPYFFMQLKVLARYEGDERRECPRFERTYRQYLANDTGARILKDDLKGVGVEVVNLALLDPSADGHVSLVGRTLDVTCEHDAYQGRPVERWQLRKPRKKLGPDAVGQLAARFGHVLQGKNKPATSPVAEPPAQDGPGR
jgi:hypothetical protein